MSFPRRARRLLALVLLAGAPVVLAADDGPAIRLDREAEDPGRLTLTIVNPRPEWATDRGLVHPRIPGYGRIGRRGLPALPLRLERIALDPGADLRIDEVSVRWEEGIVPGLPAAEPPRDPAAGTAGIPQDAGPWWPATPVRIVSRDGMLRDLRFATLAVTPLAIAQDGTRFRFARRIVVRLRVAGGRPGPARTLAATPRDGLRRRARRLLLGGETVAPVGPAPDAPRTRGAPTEATGNLPAWQLLIARDGLYRVTHAWLQANAPDLLAFLEANDPRQIRLTCQGTAVPILVEGESDGAFGPGDAIVFWGQPVVGDPFSPSDWQGGDYTDVNVYRLDLDPAPPRVDDNPVVAPPTIGVVPPSFRETVHHEEDRKFSNQIPSTTKDHWYVDPFLLFGGTESLDQIVATPGHVGGPVDVRVRLMGFDRLHQTQVRVDGTLVDTQDWDGIVEFTHDVPLDRSANPLAATTTVNVTITNARSSDQVAINWVEIDYDRAFAADGDRLVFTVPNDQDWEVRLSGFSQTPEIWEITDETASAAGLPLALPRQVQGVALSAGLPAFDVVAGAAPRRFAAAAAGGFLELDGPEAVREETPTTVCPGGSLKGADCGASWIVIGPAHLLGGPELAALRARREAQGLVTAAIDVQDVYDEFTYGIADPEAIRMFLDHALPGGTSTPWSPAPEYVVLLGDASHDYKNNYGHAIDRNILSTYIFDKPDDPNFKMYTSDLWFAAVRGSDELPDVLVGRVPAHDLAEAEEVFRKIVDYETAGSAPGWTGHALLVTEAGEDPADPLGGEFRRVHDEVFADWFTSGPQTADKLYEQDPWVVGCQAAADQQNLDIDAAVNAGAAVSTYVGHGGFKSWGKACSFFETALPGQPGEDLDDIAPGTALEFQVHANCITGAFSATSSTTSSNDSWYVFMEDWLTTADKGIVGGIAPSHLSFDVLLDPIIDPFYEQLFGRERERQAGAIDLAIRSRLFAQNFVVPGRSLIFFGDPALTLAVPAPDAPEITAIDPVASHELRVSWTPVPGAASYRVYRSPDARSGYVLAGEVPAGTTELLDTGLTNCTEYFYYVVAVDDRGFESRWSNFNDTCNTVRDPADCKSGIPENPDPPPPPAWTTGTAGEPPPVEDLEQGGRLRLNWKPVDPSWEIVRYDIHWGTAPGGPYPQTKQVRGNETTTIIAGLTDGQEYFFVINAAHCSQAGPTGEERSGIPHLVRGIDPPGPIDSLRVFRSPDGDNGTTDGADDTRLTWSPPAASEWGLDTVITGYEIHGSPDGPRFVADQTTLLGTTDAATTQFVHELAPASPPDWYYLVVALDADGLRSPAGSAFPAAVEDLRLARSGTTGDLLALRWTGVAGANRGGPGPAIDGYQLYGRPGLLPRADTGDANRLERWPHLGEGVEHAFERAMPGEGWFTFQLLSVDSHGTEAVW